MFLGLASSRYTARSRPGGAERPFESPVRQPQAPASTPALVVATVVATVAIYYSNSSSSGVDFEFELERLSSDLNLPQGLTPEAVGIFATVPFGPIFLVGVGELHLESIGIREGNATNSTANAIVSGGGVNAINSNVSVSDCVFEDNFAEFLGGGIHGNLSTLTVKDSVFHGNHAGFRSYAGDENVDGAGGGIAVREGSFNRNKKCRRFVSHLCRCAFIP